jgi:tetratricopeptide (TPR) repeat protein
MRIHNKARFMPLLLPGSLILCLLLVFSGCAEDEEKIPAPELQDQPSAETQPPAISANENQEPPLTTDKQTEGEAAAAPAKKSAEQSGYIPPLRSDSFTGPLPSFGISIAELNPANYKKVDAYAMQAMGMEQYYVLYLSGVNLYKAGDYNNAIGEYTRSIALNGGYANAYVSRGNAYRVKGNSSLAIADYTQALRINSGYAEVYNYRGFVYAAQGEPAKAIEDYTQAIRRKTGYADAYYNRGDAYDEQKEYAKAIQDYTKVIELEPQNAAAYHRRAGAWYNTNNDDAAIKDYSQAIRLKPDNAVYYRNRGIAWHSKGDQEKAAADLAAADKIKR